MNTRLISVLLRSSGCYHPCRYRLQLFCTATAKCACTYECKIALVCLVWILTETVFERSNSVDIIRVLACVPVTVGSKDQIWAQTSLVQRYLRVECQLNSDKALRVLCLKGHVRAHGSTL